MPTNWKREVLIIQVTFRKVSWQVLLTHCWKSWDFCKRKEMSKKRKTSNNSNRHWSKLKNSHPQNLKHLAHRKNYCNNPIRTRTNWLFFCLILGHWTQAMTIKNITWKRAWNRWNNVKHCRKTYSKTAYKTRFSFSVQCLTHKSVHRKCHTRQSHSKNYTMEFGLVKVRNPNHQSSLVKIPKQFTWNCLLLSIRIKSTRDSSVTWSFTVKYLQMELM